MRHQRDPAGEGVGDGLDVLGLVRGRDYDELSSGVCAAITAIDRQQ